MARRKWIMIFAVLAMASLAACHGLPGGSAGGLGKGETGVYFAQPLDGAVFEDNEVKIVMAVQGKEVRPAGEIIPGTGHHHLIINSDASERGETVARSRQTFHYSNGETKAVITLPTGTHTLTLQFANGLHVSYGEEWRHTIKVTVK